MLGLAALILAATSANASASFTTATPWWEKITYTLRDDGAQQDCLYESSLTGTESCGDEEPVPAAPHAGTTPGSYTKITFERRFTPGAEPGLTAIHSGDTLLGGQVMALAIDGSGRVSSCKVIAESGKLRPDYGCDDVRAERFAASATKAGMAVHQGYMTILVYGHEEHLA